jgi:ubiquinone/menaquinone biosynthesis C-methylase UbiE
MDHRQEDYEYQGLMATTWDLFRGDTSGWPDRFFFRDLILQSGQPALDVGCGTGRLLLDYLASGLDVDGVDISPDMLALCLQRAEELGLSPSLYQQAMENLDLPRRYRTIIVPSSSFQLVIEPYLAAQAMGRFYAHLLPGGILAMPFMAIWQEGKALKTDWEPSGEQIRPEDGALVRRWSQTRYDPSSQLEHTEDRYEVSLNGEVIAAEHHRRSPATRGYSQEQAVQLYRDAGFGDIRIYREFSFEPARAGDAIYIIVGTREEQTT